MNAFFILIYRFFNNRRKLLLASMSLTFVVLFVFATRISIDESLTSFFPDNGDARHIEAISNLKAMDKIVVLISQNDTISAPDCYSLIDVADQMSDSLLALVGDNVKIQTTVNDSAVDDLIDYVYSNLPFLLTDSDFVRLDSITSQQSIENQIKSSYSVISSPMSVGAKSFVARDPLGLATPLLMRVQELGNDMDYSLIDGYIFTSDLRNLVFFIEPSAHFENTGSNDRLISQIDDVISYIESENNVTVYQYGAPTVAVVNSRQVKHDEVLTLAIALIVIAFVVTLLFRNIWSMLLISLPVLWGGLFALATISAVGMDVSIMAIGAGSTILGVAMSYSIHVISHRQHTETIEQLIEEMITPLTIGSFTTIGAFVGLMFTSSKLLRDLGLFASLALVGTTIFCLVFLPHLLPKKRKIVDNFLSRLIDKISNYDFSRNKLLISLLCVITVVCLFFMNDVHFDSDMTHLNYSGDDKLQHARNLVEQLYDKGGHKATLVVTGSSVEELTDNSKNLIDFVDSLKNRGLILSSTSISPQYIVPIAEQKARLARWNSFWSDAKRKSVCESISKSADAAGFAPGCFAGFDSVLMHNYEVGLPSVSYIDKSPVFGTWFSQSDSLLMFANFIVVPEANRDSILSLFEKIPSVAIADRGYFVRKTAVAVVDDFNLILYISSILVGLALLISYGRFELFVISFLPMCITWAIILGLMGIFGIEFNVVNIIISTFIFGVGDDFSIFIMDGLQTEYRSGRKMLSSHKMAIALSAFTIIVGMGAQIFATHPAVRSIGLISILGMLSVIFTSYTVQPILFKLFISNRFQTGASPLTLLSMMRSMFFYIYFAIGCVVANCMCLVLSIIPIGKQRRIKTVHYLVHVFMNGILLFAKWRYKYKQIGSLDNIKPSIIVANHTSFIDIVIMLALSHKVVMLAKPWVIHSWLFGAFVRYCGFIDVADGGEKMLEQVSIAINDGYSVVVFPEGTRSEDGTIHRFHKGAFMLAQNLKLDIIPVLFYGHGMVIPKNQPAIINRGQMVCKILQPIVTDENSSESYSDYAKRVCSLMRKEYSLLCNEYDVASNPYFYSTLIQNYTYKGPVLEWYMRVKVKMEKSYKVFDEMLPRNGSIVDIGCGYGPLSFMLSMLSHERKIVGIDYDADKIAVANNSFLINRLKRSGCEIDFVAADACEYDYPNADAFVFSDVLHYMSHEKQTTLLDKCLAHLNTNGIIVVRDGDSSKPKRHKLTKLTEVFSTKIVRFNKTQETLSFTSADLMKSFAEKHDLNMQMFDNDAYTSNTIYMFSRKN